MESTSAISRLTDQPALDAIAEPLSNAIKGAYESAGEAGRLAKNALHGVWLGHPLHPVVTDIPIGAWTTGMVLDAVAAGKRDRGMERASDVAIAVGLAGAAAAAVTGLTDWSETSGRSKRTGLVHGLLNITATALYATAFILRKNGARSAGQPFAIAGYGIAMGSAYLGGALVYDERIGVTHAAIDEPETFTAVAESSAVPDDTMTRAKKGDVDLLLARQHGRLCALAHPCAHMGGPLSEGTLKEGSVVCPWHGSEFRLHDGRVLNGPATQDQPSLDVREVGGSIEVKSRDAG
jgi:nitrite reductase/ring-hydroxylating ferredoxin subunit/uncharacterized membrane protein